MTKAVMKQKHTVAPLALMRLQQLISPSLPIGAFTYSQGMEYANQAGWLNTKTDVYHWLLDVINHNLGYFELPLIYHMQQAISQNDWVTLRYLHAYNLASRETGELRLEEMQRGQALYQVLSKLVDDKQQQRLQAEQDIFKNSFISGFAFAQDLWQIPSDIALLGYAFSFIENMVTVCVKLIPLGQSDGQDLIYQLSAKLPEICQVAQQIPIDDIGGALPAMAIASSRHESQYCRLFRS